MNVLNAMLETVQLAASTKTMPRDGPLGYQHIASMYVQMKTSDFSYGKSCRWLGWAQAAVVASGGASLEDMKEINKRHK